MSDQSRRIIKTNICILAMLTAASLFSSISGGFGPVGSRLSRAGLLAFYLSAIVAWGVSADTRIANKSVKNNLVIMSIMMIFWFIVRTIKFNFLTQPHAIRLAWYSYYIPMMVIPLVSFYISLYVDESNTWHMPLHYWLLAIPSASFILIILTNELHQLAFAGFDPHGPWVDEYSTHEPVYYAAVVWMIMLFIGMLAHLYRKCRVSESRERIWQPTAVLLTALLYAVLYIQWTPIRFYELTPTICSVMIAFIECLINTGLIPSNTRHDKLFEASDIGAIITDKDYNVRYRSSTSRELTLAEMEESQQENYFTDENTLLLNAPIKGGYIIWEADVSREKTFVNELRDKKSELEDAIEVLRVENELTRRQTRVDVQNALYDRIAVAIEPGLKLIEAMMDEDNQSHIDSRERRKLVAVSCVLGAYIKRRSNLITISQTGDGTVPANELSLCIRESCDYIRSAGIPTSFSARAEGTITADQAFCVYDFFQNVIKELYRNQCSIMVNLKADSESISLMINSELLNFDSGAVEEICAITAEEYGADARCMVEDNTYYVNLILDKNAGAEAKAAGGGA